MFTRPLAAGCIGSGRRLNGCSVYSKRGRDASTISNHVVVASCSSTSTSSTVLTLQQYMSVHGVQVPVVRQPQHVPSEHAVKSMVLVIKGNPANTVSEMNMNGQADDALCNHQQQQQADAVTDPATTAAASAASDGNVDVLQGWRQQQHSLPGQGQAAPPSPYVLVLLTGDRRIDARAVATHLGVTKNRLRLATEEEVAAVTGFEVGSIPPFGHLTRLRTLMDLHMLQQQQHHPHQAIKDVMLYAGSGVPDMQLRLSAQDLLAATAAETGSFSTAARHASAAVNSSPSASMEQLAYAAKATSDLGSCSPVRPVQDIQEQQQHTRQPLPPQSSPPLDLPLPWAPGTSEVELIGVVAQRRRIARLLLFCSLVPEAVPPLPADGTASYLRRLWQDPANPGVPCEVQVICGKTIERSLGRQEAAAIFDRIRVGSVLLVRGRVQANPAAADNGTGHVLDVVAHQLDILHRDRNALSRALRQVQQRGHASVRTAAQLRGLQQLPATPTPLAVAHSGTTAVNGQPIQRRDGNNHSSELVTASANKSSSSSSSSREEREVVTVSASTDLDPPAYPSVGVPAASEAGARTEGSSAQQQQQQQQQQQTGLLLNQQQEQHRQSDQQTGQQQQQQQQYWQLPLPVGRIHWIESLQGIQRMQVLLLGQPPAAAEPDTEPMDASSIPVVGIDCEWRPYDRQEGATPVALLQLATRTDVFLIDMLAVCSQQQQPQQQTSAIHGQTGVPSSLSEDFCTCAADASTPGSLNQAGLASRWSAAEAAAAELALGLFLLELFSSRQIIKLGFQLQSDLKRLQQSYPQLACFQAAAITAAGLSDRSPKTGAARLACHIDVLQFSRSAVPSLSKLPHISLSKLVDSLLGYPMNKAQQTSNWEARPLSAEQQVYAAGDAIVLTALFDELVRRLPQGVAVTAALSNVAASSSLQYLPITTTEA